MDSSPPLLEVTFFLLGFSRPGSSHAKRHHLGLHCTDRALEQLDLEQKLHFLSGWSFRQFYARECPIRQFLLS